MRQMGHEAPINMAEGMVTLYRRIFREAMAARMSGEWDGEDLYEGWDIPRVQEIIKENHWEENSDGST